jgi:putative transposase
LHAWYRVRFWDMTQSRSRIVVRTVLRVADDTVRLVALALRSHAQLAAENLFLRKQLALYVERQVKPCRAEDATRITLVALSVLVDWRRLLTVVKPGTLIRWHRKGFRLFWRCKSRPVGRPRIPRGVQQLIAQMATENVTWGEERIAAELQLKLGLRVSPRTIRRYMPRRGSPRGGRGSQAWSTFVRNHARAVLACDFFVTVTASFRVVDTFVVLEVGTRRIVHWNVTEHPRADWTLQQFRMIIPGDQPHRFVVHDRDSVFSAAVDEMLTDARITVLQTPVRSPQANAYCERLIGTIRRECLDWVIPLNERHLRRVLAEWVAHYNQGRPHAGLGPGLPDPPATDALEPSHRHRLPPGCGVGAKPVLGGLHHEYQLKSAA